MDLPVTDDEPEPSPHPPPPSDQPSGSIGGWFASLRRSTSGALFGGVAAGLGKRSGVPVVLVRAGFVLMSLVGVGIALYLLAWVFVPTDRGERLIGRDGIHDLAPVAAVAVAGLILMGQVAEVSTFRLAWRLAPWALLFAGLALVLRRTGSPAPPPGSAEPAAPGQETVEVAGPAPEAPAAPVAAGAPAPPRPARPPRRRWRRPRQRPVVAPLTWCAVLVVVGVAGLLWVTGSYVFNPGTLAAVCLIIFGGGLVVSAFRGRAQGLILPAAALALALGSLGVLDVRADVVGGVFDRTLPPEEEVPAELRSTMGPNRIDLRHVRLDRDRELRIDQTLGPLEIGLPARTTTEVEVWVGYGDAQVHRPSLRDAGHVDVELTRRWTEEGLPEPGSLLSDDVGGDQWWRSIPVGWPNEGSSTRTSLSRTFEHGSDHTLRIVVELGLGSVHLYDPHWSSKDHSLELPVQLCTVGGGPRGVVEPCDDVDEAERVPLCINAAGFLVDCREDPQATSVWPHTAACRGFDGQHRPCQLVGIEPIGADLATGGPDEEPPEPTTDTIAPLAPAPSNEATDGDDAPDTENDPDEGAP